VVLVDQVAVALVAMLIQTARQEAQTQVAAAVAVERRTAALQKMVALVALVSSLSVICINKV
jgi:hypothetical protein